MPTRMLTSRETLFMAEHLQKVPSENWVARKELYDQIVEEVRASSNTAAHFMFPQLISAEQSIRHTVGHVRSVSL